MFLWNINIGANKHFVEDAFVQRSVLEALIHFAISQGESVWNAASQELGRDVGLGLIVICVLGVGVILTVSAQI